MSPNSPTLLLLLLTAGLMFVVQRSHAAKILVMSPSLCRSIMLLLGRLADVLVQDGHDVTVWIPEMVSFNADFNGTRLAQRVVRMGNLSRSFEASLVRGMVGDAFYEYEKQIFPVSLYRFELDSTVADFCESIVAQKEQLEWLRRERFDLAFHDTIDPCMTGIVHHLGIKRWIWVSTGPITDFMNWALGIPHPIGVVPTLQDTLIGPGSVSTIWERLHNALMYFVGQLSAFSMVYKENASFRRHIDPNFPPLEQLTREASLVFLVGDEFLNPAFPTLAKVVHIGGVGIEQPQPLPEELAEVVERGRKGAVYMTLGTLTQTGTLDTEKLHNIFATFGVLDDYQFIVRITHHDKQTPESAKNFSNIHFTNWAPQTDLLAHPRIRLFISHCGYNGLLEGAMRGVPMLCIPLYFDQFRNAKTLEFRGFGKLVQKRTLGDPARIEAAIREVLEDKRYAQQAKRHSRLFTRKPMGATRAVQQWTRFVLENGPLAELTAETAKVPLTQYFGVDLLVLVAACVALAVGVARWIARRLFAVLYASDDDDADDAAAEAKDRRRRAKRGENARKLD